MTTQTSKVNIGTLIHGTLRNEDLIPAFTSELAYLSDGQHPLLTEINEYDVLQKRLSYSEDISLESQQDIASDLVNDLIDALNDYAPAHTYFGTLEGDGSDFGFWPDADSFEDCRIVGTPTDSEITMDLDCEIYIHINDHGNVTTYDLNRNEIWSVV